MARLLVLRACEGATPLFEIARDGDQAWSLVGRDLVAGQDADMPSLNLALRIDRLVFFEQPDVTPINSSEVAVLELPFIPGSVQLKITGTPATKRHIEIGYGLVRCFLKDHQTGGVQRSEAALVQMKLQPQNATSATYSPLIFPKKEFKWHKVESCSNAAELPLLRSALENVLFSFDTGILGLLRGWTFELGKLFGLPQSNRRTVWVARVFSFDDDADEPLQIEFSAFQERDITYDLTSGGLPNLQFHVRNLRWRQRPARPVGSWNKRGGGGAVPEWIVEMALAERQGKPGEISQEILEYYNENVAIPIHDALRVVRRGQPLSLVPLLEIEKQNGSPTHNLDPNEWLLEIVVSGEWEKLKPTPGGERSKPIDFPNDFGSGKTFSIGFGNLRPARLPEQTVGGAAQPVLGKNGLLLKATFPSFATTVGGPDPLPLRLPFLAHGVSASQIRFGSELEVEIALSPVVAASASEKDFQGITDKLGQRVRLGALELAFGSADPSSFTAPVLLLSDIEAEAAPALRWSLISDLLPKLPPQACSPIVSGLELLIPALATNAAGQDPLPGEEFAEMFEADPRDREDRIYEDRFRREPPLVLALESATGNIDPARPAFLLSVAETVLRIESQTVDLRLSQREDLTGLPLGVTQRLWIVDRDPLLIAEVRFQDFLSDLIAGTTNEVANFSTRSGAAWEISAGARGFDLVLPPQGVGEAMEKNKGVVDGRPADINEHELVAYRFTPPTKLRVLPSYFEQRFAEPPWNLRRLLGYPGQRDPGMSIERVDFELFYGLKGTIKRDDLRLAEILARLGAVPGRQPRLPLWPASDLQQQAYQAHRMAWSQWYELVAGRLAVLEPWQYGQRDRELGLTEGIEYELRRSARLAFPTPIPVNPATNAPDYARLKALAPAVPPETYDPAISTSELAPGAPLPGGISWPFESINLYNLLWTQPQAESGELHRPFFSALGGWGFQKAVFADGQLRIYADTAMGRTHSVTLEIFGRISVGWHLAKLVIIYERSVLPTRQFVFESNPGIEPTVEAGEQDALRGRAVLRKVREYVEILEPVRRFPDHSETPLECGCVVGLEFPEGARRINVSSRWGQDVGRAGSPADEAEGWKVPLWLRGAQPEDVYPQPQIVALFAPAQGDALVRAEIDEPEKLYFFTSTKPGRERQPQAWPAIRNIDFCAINPAKANAPDFPDEWKRGELNTGPRPDDAVRAGLGPFTFALKPASQAMDVMAARNPQRIGALLRNVTLMRGYQEMNPPLTSDQEDFFALRDHVEAGAAVAREWIGQTREALRAGAGADQAKALLQEVPDQVKELRRNFEALFVTPGAGGATKFQLPDFSDLCPKLGQRVRGVLSPLRVAGKALGDNFGREALGRVDAALSIPGIVFAEVKKTLTDAGDIAKARWKSELRRLNPLLESAQRAAGPLLANASARGFEAIGGLRDFAHVVESLPAAWPAAEAIWESSVEPLREARAAVRAAFSGIDDAIEQAVRPWVGALPDAFRINLKPALEAVEVVLGQIEKIDAIDDLDQAFTDGSQADYEQAVVALAARARELADQLSPIWSQVTLGGAQELGAILTQAQDLRDRLEQSAGTEWDKSQAALLKAFDGLADPITPEKAEALRNALRTRIDEMLGSWDAALDSVENGAIAGLDGMCQRFFGTAAEYLNYLQWLLADARIQKWLDDAVRHLPTGDELQRRLAALERELGQAARGLVERASAVVNDALQDAMKPVTAAGDSILRLVRAFGEAPRVPSLDFRLPDVGDRLAHIGYYFQDLAKKIPLPHVDLTPVLAGANDLGKDLVNALQIKLPTTSLLDRIKPASLPSFDLSKIFPDFAGLKLADLFEGLKLPAGANDNVKITHGEDPQSLTGWVQIEVDQAFAQNITVFAFAGLVMSVSNGRFRATSRIEGGAGQGPRQSFQGEVSGNWMVSVGSFQLLILESTALRFDDAGRITFDVQPDKVRLPGPMAFLADLISKFDFGLKGFTFKVTPTGVQIVLNLPLPDIQAGAFGMANLSLGFFFELAVLPSFVVTGGASIASRHSPFTIIVFILGGAGWFDFRFRYAPGKGVLVATVSIGIMAAASVAVAVGPISGGVYAYFGIVVEYTARRGAAGSLVVTLVIRFVGQVSLLAIVSAFLELGLEAQYSTGGGLVGRGYINVEIEICWCFTLSISCSVSYTFGGGGGGQKLFAAPAPGAPPPITYHDAADEYSEMFA
jgi:hypothetical protein